MYLRLGIYLFFPPIALFFFSQRRQWRKMAIGQTVGPFTETGSLQPRQEGFPPRQEAPAHTGGFQPSQEAPARTGGYPARRESLLLRREASSPDWKPPVQTRGHSPNMRLEATTQTGGTPPRPEAQPRREASSSDRRPSPDRRPSGQTGGPSTETGSFQPRQEDLLPRPEAPAQTETPAQTGGHSSDGRPPAKTRGHCPDRRPSAQTGGLNPDGRPSAQTGGPSPTGGLQSRPEATAQMEGFPLRRQALHRDGKPPVQTGGPSAQTEGPAQTRGPPARREALHRDGKRLAQTRGPSAHAGGPSSDGRPPA